MAAPVRCGSRLLLTVFLLSAFVSVLVLSHEHHHGHAHDDHGHAHGHEPDAEPAHFKYSKQANEAEVTPDVDEEYGHDEHEDHHHDHGHDHGHGHDAHGHSHDAHGHSHDAHGHSHDAHGHDHHDHGHYEKPTSTTTEKRGMLVPLGTWLRALGSTALVSIAPVFILLLIPLDNSKERQSLLKILLSFASGGLLGDAFLHLIPHALSPHSHGGEEDGHGHSHSHDEEEADSHGHSHGRGMTVGLWVLAGIIVFLAVEKFVRIVKGEDGHGHSHSVKKPEAKKSDTAEKESDKKKDKPEEKGGDDKKGKEVEKKEKDDAPKKKVDKKKTKSSEQEEGDIKVAGYLNLVADATHNFTDGLAIGVSYLLGQNIGILTTITILLHEVPHEVGDFAILVQSGCSKRKAMMLQFTTAIGAMTGTVVSLALGGVGPEAMAWILPFTAGGFIYIATVSVIPELLADSKFWQSVKEIAALLTGVLMMVIIAVIE